ncbi:unnamed protein product [Ambrosiozyma monospora]|uniref:Unnamed protein product n=1 Tax=Ambrosiozyma monospora TaxID=43982 RepID=A0ACB5SS72_AMBMO|nr:unnamed protein product [Ambrosiozyma monospora]
MSSDTKSPHPKPSHNVVTRETTATAHSADADVDLDVDSNTKLTPLNDEDSTSVLMELDNGTPSLLVISLTFLASISGFMFGYDTGYISSALVAIGDDFGTELTYGQEQFITAATSLGALITAICAGPFTDIVGRKPVLMFSNILFVVGSVIQCASQTVWTMIVGRFVMGFGVGIGSLIAPFGVRYWCWIG